ncbi:MAG TPA: response regulator transcription factor [Polyangiaceae bacterium]|nr:response regulator transcription factor [Polyangiaceae bacterium]
MRVVLVNGERADEVGLGGLLGKSGVEWVSMRISAACLRDDQYVWRMASGYPGLVRAEASDTRQPRGLLIELSDPAAAVVAVAAIRSDHRFDDFPVIASLSVDHIDWISRARQFDDFLFSPWSPIELIGRIYAAERRRADTSSERGVPASGSVSIDATARQVTIAGCSIRLTARELALFSYLWLQRGTVLSRDHLLAQVWGPDYHGGPRTVDVHVRRLRSKLGTLLTIDTVRSGGYRMLVPACTPDAVQPLGSAAPLFRPPFARGEPDYRGAMSV